MRAVWLETREERESFELRLEAAGHDLPLDSRAAFSELMGLRTRFVAVEDDDGLALGGTAVRWQQTRALPGCDVLRVERFGAGVQAEVAGCIARELVRTASNRRVLAVQLDACLASDDVHRALCDAGFVKTPMGRTYARSALVDLTPDGETILARFHATARRHIRVASRAPVSVKRITYSQWAPRMSALLHETFSRTGDAVPVFNARAWLRLAAEHPEWVAIIGMFDEHAGANALLGYVIAVRHGSVAEYRIAASTRDTAFKLPILYAPTWEAMRWARMEGARVWDFGGISRDSHGAGPRGGISDFKRYFSGREERVGYEFGFEPSRLRSGAARAVRFAGRVMGLAG